MHEEQKERGLVVATVEQLEQYLVESETISFKKARERYFMIDLIPENDARFPIMWTDVDTRGVASSIG